MKILAASLLLLISVSHAMDPPAIEWYRVYPEFTLYNAFYDVHEIEGGFLASAINNVVFFDDTGNVTATMTPEDFGVSSMLFSSIIPLADGDFIAAGDGLADPGSTGSLFITRISSNATPIWFKNYDFPNAHAYGNSIALLPDSGFAVCGKLDPFDDQPQGIIFRCDSSGDTLWTREWGWPATADWAGDVVCYQNGIIVYTHGNPPETPKGGYLVRYDMDGNLEWQNLVEPMAGKGAQDMCHASDNGLLLLNDTYPLIVHTDYEGNVDWYQTPQGWAQDIGWSINTTMDGGFIVGLDAGNEPGSEGIFGVASRHSVSGEIEWWDYVYEGGCSALHCIRQLSEGGYIAAGLGGEGGMLLKYAPETGISKPDQENLFSLEVAPNPCSSVLSVSFSLPDAGNASVRIYDLSGRMVSCAAQGEFTAGWNTVEWAVPEELSSGCYFVQYNSDIGSCTESVALIK